MRTEKDRLLQELVRMNIVSPTEMRSENTRYPFFDKNHLPLIDYITVRDIMELADLKDQPELFALLLVMFHQLSEGSLCLNLEKSNLISYFEMFTDPKIAKNMAESILEALEADRWNRMISRREDQYRPLVLVSLTDRTLLYFQKYNTHEKRLAARVKTFLRSSNPALPIMESKNGSGKEAADAIVEELYSEKRVLRVTATAEAIKRDPFQEEAIRLAIRTGFVIVSGGPGTGKTSLMVNILRCLARAGHAPEKMLLCAPTGRAAQRMTEAITRNIDSIREVNAVDERLRSLKGSTLHKALRYSPRFNRFHYGKDNPLPASVVIMDEVSMVDVVMMEKFLSAVDTDKTRVILLGDKDQLPSVEAGAVLADMIPENSRSGAFKDHLVVLENVYRSEHNLQKLAKTINAAERVRKHYVLFDDAMKMEKDQWALVESDSLNTWRKNLNVWAEHHYLSSFTEPDRKNGDSHGDEMENDGYANRIISASKMTSDRLANSNEGQMLLKLILSHIERARILTLVRNGPHGCTLINRQVCAYLSSRLETLDWVRWNMFSGQMIIITRNDYARELFNGDIGVILKDSEGVFRAWFNRPNGPIGYSPSQLPGWESAFALTVHKSQGSEFDNVLVALAEEENHRLLTREMIYTAVTRAKQRVIIHAKPSVLKAALERRIQRESGLLQRLDPDGERFF